MTTDLNMRVNVRTTTLRIILCMNCSPRHRNRHAFRIMPRTIDYYVLWTTVREEMGVPAYLERLVPKMLLLPRLLRLRLQPWIKRLLLLWRHL